MLFKHGGRYLTLTFVLIFTSCGLPVTDDTISEDGGTSSSGGAGPSPSTPKIEPTAEFAIALGGVLPGRDELVLYDDYGAVRNLEGHTLEFEIDNPVIGFIERTGYATFASGSGARLIPQEAGSGAISYLIDGRSQDETYQVVVPPQSLIQILLGEARGQITKEAYLGDDGLVELSSTSPTANAIASVVRTRVQLLESGQPLSLFMVDKTAWEADPPQSHWDAVITAKNQFQPLDPNAASHEVYTDAEVRAWLDSSNLVAYDQAVLTAAGIFNNEIADPTGGAFSFRSPSSSETRCLRDALASGVIEFPSGCGPGDANFPAFAPVQVLIHPSVALQSDGRPSFVFYRNRSPEEPVVTNAP